MCYSKASGKGRCNPSNASKVQAASRRKERLAHEYLEQVVKDNEEWRGTVEIDTSHPDVAKAYAIAILAHAGVKRVTGDPYINHPLRAARRLQRAGMDSDFVAAALLHDVVEDSDFTLGYLRRRGFNARIISAVDSVTKREGEPYEEAVARASKDPVGRIVKLSDNLDNSSPEQIASFDEERKQRATLKYAVAREKLMPYIMESVNSFIDLRVDADKLRNILNFSS